jgi:catechol 2,3-dioxygenase-like lactoylglutathione lyase family enzyme
MPAFTQSRYVLAVPNLKASAEYYRSVLGFKVREFGDPGWLFFERDNCVIMAGECCDAIPPRDLGDHSYFGYIVVTNIADFYESVRAANGELIKLLQDEPWGMTEFGVRTGDGHRIMFGSPTTRAS